MHSRSTLVGSLLVACSALAGPALAQSVVPPFDTTYSITNVGSIAGINGYGGTAFLPANPNVLLVAQYPFGQIVAVPMTRDAQNRITGSGTPTLHATVGGSDGGLAFGPNGVLFVTWYGVNRLSQVEPNSTTTDRVDDLAPLGVTQASVGACTFVPPGFPGAGRLKLGVWPAGVTYDLPLTPDGNGTFAPGPAASPAAVAHGVEGLVYAPLGAPAIGGKLLVAEWTAGTIAAFGIDQIGDPIAATRQVVVAGATSPGGGAVDPLTGDIVFLQASGQLLVLRVAMSCGTFTNYGPASPGVVTPTITGTGCPHIGQSISIDTTGPANGIGLLAVGSQINVPFLNLTVLQSVSVTVVSALSPAGTASFPITIPFVPSLGNAHLYMQAAYLDATTASGLCASNGLDLLIL